MCSSVNIYSKQQKDVHMYKATKLHTVTDAYTYTQITMATFTQ